MSEFFLELFSEEIPAGLQKNLRENLLKSFNDFFEEKSISFKRSSSYSTPNRLVILFEGLQKQTILKSEEIKGPSTKAPDLAIEGFIRSKQILKQNLYEKETEKGNFFFFKTKSKKLYTHELLEEFVPKILDKIQWKKSMRWGDFSLNWGRPLKSILAIFNKKTLIFKFHHIQSSNFTFVDKDFEEKKIKFSDFKKYKNFFKKKQIIIDPVERKKIIEKKFHFHFKK